MTRKLLKTASFLHPGSFFRGVCIDRQKDLGEAVMGFVFSTL
jgi:hypothetical protein